MLKDRNRIWIAGSYVAAAAVAGFLFAWAEFFIYRYFPPGPYIGWTFYHGSGFQSWGINWPGQLLAHKSFAYGWAVPALAAFSAVVTFPLKRLLRKIGLGWGSTAVGWACGLTLLFHGVFLNRILVVQEIPLSYPKAVVPLAGIAITLAAAVALSIKPVSRIVRSRLFPIAVTVLWVLAALGSFGPSFQKRPAPSGPNVVIITIDALRADKVGSHSAGASLTPNIDRWGEGATRFDRCVAPSIWTLTSLASMHTGVYPSIHDTRRRLPLGLNFETLAERYREAGYDTACIAGNMLCEPRFGLIQGFKYCRTMEMAAGTLESRLYYTALPWPFYSTDRMMYGTTPVIERRALGYLNGRKGVKRPFFLWVHFLDPHDPYDPPRAFVSAEVDAARRPMDPGEADTLDDASRVEIEALYDGEVRHVDDAVGRLLGALKNNGLDSRTAVVITSDHGEEFWEHRRQGHGHQFFDETLCVPLIVKAPDIWKPGLVHEQARLLDLYATVLAFGGMSPRLPNQAQPINPAAPGTPADLIAFSSNPFDGDLSRVAVTDGKKKYVVSLEADTYEGFDLIADPRELDPDSETPIDPLFRKRLLAWRAENRELISYYGVKSKAIPFMDTQLKALGYIK